MIRLVSMALIAVMLGGAAPVRGAQTTEPQTQGVLTLQQALQHALTKNPSALRSRSEIEAAESRVRQIRSSVLPQIIADGRYTRNDREVAFDFGGEQIPIMPTDDWSASIRLNQPIFAGGRELKAIRQARLNVDEREEFARQTDEALLFDVASSYVSVIGAEALINVEQQNLQLSQQQRKQAQDFFEAGEVTRVDVLRAETTSKGAERRLAAARQARENAASVLRLSIGEDVPVQVVTPEIALPAMPSEADLIARAEGRRPEVQRARITFEIARLEVAKQQGAYLPVITAEAAYTQQASAFPADQYGAVTLNFSVPIFTSGEIGSRIAIAREQERQARLAYEEAQQVVREDVRRALVAFNTAETELALALEQRDAAEAEYAQISELYQAQEATSLDVQTAEISLASARRAVVTAALDREIAALNVWYSAGGLRGVVLEENNE